MGGGLHSLREVKDLKHQGSLVTAMHCDSRSIRSSVIECKVFTMLVYHHYVAL